MPASKLQRRKRYLRKLERRTEAETGKPKRPLNDGERRDVFRRQMRARELADIETERKKRIANVDAWAADERRKVNEKYELGSRQIERMES